ncbi:MAG: TadE/TadG family type IV pilus assembly protein [Acidimicrobiales bacterium]
MNIERRRARRRSGRGDERGAAMVEFAIIATVFLMLAFGTFEMGTAWSDSQLVTQAARTGARTATQLGQNAAADSFSVESIEAALGDLDDDVTRIVIFDAGAADGAMPPARVAASPPGIVGSCSIYDKNDFGTYGAWVDGAWLPSARDDSFSGADYVGVSIDVARPYVTGFFSGSTFNITDTTVMRIEPETS